MRVEGLLAAFPKLMGHSRQHTFVETDAVRYVYQPLENNMFLLLITNKASNIVEDLGTLRLLAKVVPDVTGSISEHSVNEHAFEIIFAFDEVLTTGGYKEDISPSTIRTNLEMHSHEEEMALMLKKSKEEAAKGQMQAQAKAIKDRQMAALRDNLMHGGSGGAGARPPSGMVGFGGGGPQRPGGFDMFGQGGGNAPMGGGMGGGFGGSPTSSDNPYANLGKLNEPAEPEAPKVMAKGMKLGGVGGIAKKKDSLMAGMLAEDNLASFGGSGGGGNVSSDPFGLGLGAPAAAAPSAPSAPATILVEERMVVHMSREGEVKSSEVKGTITYTANTNAGTEANVTVNKSSYSGKCGAGWSFATHPKVDKASYEKSGLLTLKGGKPYPLNRPVGILRWNYSGTDSAPFTVTCWPEDEGSGTINVNMEFELQRSDAVITDVNIVFPLGSTDAPAIEAIDGQYKHDPSTGMMCWHHDVIDANNSSGSLEFSIAGRDVDVFFPVQIAFTSESLMCPMEITSLVNMTSGASIPNNMTVRVVPESYQCA